MTINKIAYISVKSFDQLEKFLNKNNIYWSKHKDEYDEEEIWMEIFDDTINILSVEFLNDNEIERCQQENVEYIIFYEN